MRWGQVSSMTRGSQSLFEPGIQFKSKQVREFADIFAIVVNQIGPLGRIDTCHPRLANEKGSKVRMQTSGCHAGCHVPESQTAQPVDRSYARYAALTVAPTHVRSEIGGDTQESADLAEYPERPV